MRPHRRRRVYRAGPRAVTQNDAKQTYWTKMGTIIAIITLMVTLILGVLSMPDWSSSLPLKAEFTNLRNNDVIALDPADAGRYRVEGKNQGASPVELFCIVTTATSGYYPYGVSAQNNGQWNSTIGLGPVKISEKHYFTIILATATAEARREIAKVQRESKGMDKLPDGISEIVSINITRTN